MTQYAVSAAASACDVQSSSPARNHGRPSNREMLCPASPHLPAPFPFPGVDEHAGPSLYQVQATGAFQRYRAVATGGSGAEATARLASVDPTDGVSTSSARGSGKGGGADIADDTGAVAGGSHSRRRRPLLPEHRVALKRAVSALWEPSSGGGSGHGGGNEDDEERPEGEEKHGGLKASELSAAIYGMQQRDASCHEGGGPTGGCESHNDAGGSESDAEKEGCRREGERAWDQGIGCTQEDFVEILLALGAEESNSI